MEKLMADLVTVPDVFVFPVMKRLSVAKVTPRLLGNVTQKSVPLVSEVYARSIGAPAKISSATAATTANDLRVMGSSGHRV
jgi:hypothetical protein